MDDQLSPELPHTVLTGKENQTMTDREGPAVSAERLGLLRAAESGRVERDVTGYMLRSYPRVDQDVTAAVDAAIADGHLTKPYLRPNRWATAPVSLTDAGREVLEES